MRNDARLTCASYLPHCWLCCSPCSPFPSPSFPFPPLLCLQVTAEVKAEGLREEIDAARAQVVSSPARLRADVEHSARLVEDAKAALAAAHGEAAAIARRREIVGKASKDVGKTLAALGELEVEVQRLKRAAKDAKAKAATRDEKAAEAAEATAQAERMQKRVRAAEDKLAEHKHR